MHTPTLRRALAIVSTAMVAGCGGGGSSSPVGTTEALPQPAYCARYEQLAFDPAAATKEAALSLLPTIFGTDAERPVDLAGELATLDRADATADERIEAGDAIGRWLAVHCTPAGVRYLPANQPDGLVLCTAIDLPRPPASAVEGAATIRLWGDRSRRDPWSGRLAATWVRDGADLPVHDDARPVSVHGTDGKVAPMPLFQAISSARWGHVVSWRDPATGKVIELAAKGTTAEEAVRLAEAVTIGEGGARLPRHTLGSRTEVLLEGPGAMPMGIEAATHGGWTASWRPADLLGSADRRMVRVEGFLGTAGDVQALRFWAVSATASRAKGQPAVAFDAFGGGDANGIAWIDPGGAVLVVRGMGLTGEEVQALADDLVPVDTTGWTRTKQAAQDNSCG